MPAARSPAVLAVALLPLVLLAAACGSTKLTSVWTAESLPAAPYGSLLVMGLSPSPGARTVFETTMVRRLEAHGVRALPSVRVLPEHGDLDREQVRTWVREHGVQGVLVTHLVDVERKTEIVQPTVYPTLTGYYGYRWGTMVSVSPGRIEERTIVKLETNLYDARRGELVWSAASRTFDPADRDTIVEEVSALVVERLAEQGLLPPAS